LEKEEGLNYNLNEYKNRYYNESLGDLVRNIGVKDRIIEHDSKLIQQIDPIFQVPEQPQNPLNYRAHFFAPEKYFLNIPFNTYTFNVMVIWFMSLFLYLILYLELLKNLINLSNRFRIDK
jgi:ABC transport system ATP-binding/permease protein